VYDCVGIGLCAVDYVCLLSHYPKLDEKMDIERFSFQGGGPVPTALVTLARLGAKTSYIGVIGDDHNGKFLLHQYEKEGIDISAVIVDKNSATNQAFIWIDKKSGKKSITLNNNFRSTLLPSEISTRHITSTRFLHIDGRETEATFAALKWAKQAGVEVVLDAGSPRNNMEQILVQVEYPVVSEHFCHAYLKTKNYETGLKKLLKFGAKAAVVTCGENGCYGADSSGIIYQPAFKVDIVDTTGAGDVFHGAFIFGLLQDWPLDKILKFASATAALKCTQLGGQLGIPGLKRVNEFLKSY